MRPISNLLHQPLNRSNFLTVQTEALASRTIWGLWRWELDEKTVELTKGPHQPNGKRSASSRPTPGARCKRIGAVVANGETNVFPSVAPTFLSSPGKRHLSAVLPLELTGPIIGFQVSSCRILQEFASICLSLLEQKKYGESGSRHESCQGSRNSRWKGIKLRTGK